MKENMSTKWAVKYITWPAIFIKTVCRLY